MKRAKIMLMSIAVLATVGTALAFKVAKKGNTTYCYLETTQAPDPAQKGACPAQIDDATAIDPVNVVYYYTTLTAIDCENQDKCEKTANNFAG